MCPVPSSLVCLKSILLLLVIVAVTLVCFFTGHEAAFRHENVVPHMMVHKSQMANDSDFAFIRKNESHMGEALRTRWQRFYGETGCYDNKMRGQLSKLFMHWIKLSKDHNIDYAIMWGSLLGLVRTNDIMAWDYDIDLIVSYDSLLKLHQIAERRGSFNPKDDNIHLAVVPNPQLQHNMTMGERRRESCRGETVDKIVDQCSFQEPMARLLFHWFFIDIYHYYEEGNTFLTIPEGRHFRFNRTDVYPLQPCHFMGMEGMCPRNPTRLLSIWYGAGCLDKNEYKCKGGVWKNAKGSQPPRDWRL